MSLESKPVSIEGEFTIYRAAELSQVLKDALAAPGDIEIHLAAVTEMDSAGVQLLLATKKTALAHQRELRILSQSPAVVEVLKLLDLAAHLGDPLLLTANTTQH